MNDQNLGCETGLWQYTHEVFKLGIHLAAF